MENLKKLLQFLKPLPVWLRVVVTALVVSLISICLLLTSCGVTQTIVNNENSHGSSIDMTVNPSQSTSTSVTPDIKLNYD